MGRFKTEEERTKKKMENNPPRLPSVQPVKDPRENISSEEKELKNKYAQGEKNRLLGRLFAKKDLMTAEYAQLIKHTGNIVSTSMTVAYSRALNDVIKFLLKEGADEDSKTSN